MPAWTTDLAELIDAGPVGPVQKTVIGLCAQPVFLDGFDAQSIGYVAPVLIKARHVAPGRMGPVFSSGLLGLMVGTLTIAPVADRYGRRPVILASTLSFGVLSLATAAASSLGALLLLRFLTGLGLGGCMPNTISLTSEYSPRRRRGFLVMMMFTGFTVGSLCAGLISAQLIPRFGWQSVFVAGGMLPLAAIVPIFLALPESIRLLAQGADGPRKARDLLLKITLSAMPVSLEDLRTADPAASRIPLGLLFREGRARNTLLLWVIFFMSLLDIHLLVNWLPTALNESGASLETAILIGATLQLGGLFGPPPLGWMLDRGGARLGLVPAYALATVCIACLGEFARVSLPLTALVVFGAGFGVLGGQTAANAVAATTYPTTARSTGAGWALGVGRIGSIVGPAVAGIRLDEHVSIRNVFLLSAAPALCAALAALALESPRSDRFPFSMPASKAQQVNQQ